MSATLKKLLSPPVFADPEENRAARTLHVLLLMLLSASVILIIIFIFRRQAYVEWGILFIDVVMLGCFVLVRRGHLTLPSYLAPLTLLGITTYMLFEGLGTHDLAILCYPMALALSGLLIGKRAPIAFVGLSVLSLALVYYGEVNGMIVTPCTQETVPSDLIVMGILLGITAALTYIAIQNVSESLGRARQNEQALRQLNEELEQRVNERTQDLQAANQHLTVLSRVKDEFVSNISHELRTPITSIMLYHDMLEANPTKHTLYIERLKRETERLWRIIEDLLQLSRFDQDRVRMHFTAVDINQLASVYAIDRTALAESRHLTLEVEKTPEIPLVQADAGLLGQALSIFLTNAINYTPEGGQVQVSTLARQEGEATWIGIRVSDTGLGIPPDEMEQIFERFFRGKVGSASHTSGTGLGLSIAKEIAERHRGRVEVQSEGLGKGAMFTIWLPTS
jgi:signal transduction histidine kinase